ncbi:hypothetical protein PC129_g15417 [Phytophthora cactorum]|uniref:Uncharacterized protein n=1 Tax=Phytophthora cactorum TaxID=29920 RepID=A0A8T1HLV1_9STRA|nr:hypothetical protein PC112_g16594 [Phytophthora cactorum]KAG3169369.1 hypothetical protein PC128_g19179 [Phytophthora cactorum]KAG3213654.1 hypothetical protein PC129_g15417 [Phytophthora cactorum]
MVTKKVAITGVVVILAVIGVIVGVLVARKSSDSASESSGTNSSGSGSTSTTSGSGTSATTSSSSNSGTTYKLKNSTSSASSSVTSDPTDAKFTLSAFAIGDWGTTVTKDSCCTRHGRLSRPQVHLEPRRQLLLDGH